jgi:hypothetical protein
LSILAIIAENRDTVREDTRNFRKQVFANWRVAWHNSLLSIHLAPLMDQLDLSHLSRSKSDARKRILAMEEENGIQYVDVHVAKAWIDAERKIHAQNVKLVSECVAATKHEMQVARIVEKGGYDILGTYEGTAELESDYKKHWDYVLKEVGKTASAAPRGGRGGNRGARGRGYGGGGGGRGRGGGGPPRGGYGGYQPPYVQNDPPRAAAARPADQATTSGPSARRPCAICKSPDHWADKCPNK